MAGTQCNLGDLTDVRCNLFADEEEVASNAMSSSQFAQTMPTQYDDDEDEDNYCAAVDGDFRTRLRWWTDHSPGVSWYHAQLCVVFEAGSCINTNHLEKEPQRYKEMALKYVEVTKAIGRDGLIRPSELKHFKSLKHATKKKKKEICEVEGWPSGRSLRWDYVLLMARKSTRS